MLTKGILKIMETSHEYFTEKYVTQAKGAVTLI